MAEETVIKGYGKDKRSALRDAERHLPFPMKDVHRYDSVHVRGYSQTGDRWEVTVGYILPAEETSKPVSQPRGTGTVAESDAVTLMRRLPR